jgi:AraC family transcriptional regulator
MALDVKTMAAMRLAAVRHSGPYNSIGPAFHRLGDIAGPAGLFARPEAKMLGIYKDDPETTPADQLRSAAGVVVAEDAPIPSGLVEERVPGGRFACFVHRGSYETLPNSWAHVQRELIAGGHRRRAGASCEIYLNNPAQVPPDQLLTEICIPVE